MFCNVCKRFPQANAENVNLNILVSYQRLAAIGAENDCRMLRFLLKLLFTSHSIAACNPS